MHEMFRHILEGVVGGKAPDDVEVVSMEVTFGGGRNEFSIQLDAKAVDVFARLFDDTQARLVVSREIERTAERHKVQPMEDVIRELDRLLNGGAPR